MLYSPTLHGLKSAASVGTFAPNMDCLAMFDASLVKPVKILMKDDRRLLCFVFPVSNPPDDDSTSVSNVAASTNLTTGYKTDFRWPFNFTCTGIRSTAGSLPPSSSAVEFAIDVFRGSNSVLTDSTSPSAALVLPEHTADVLGVKGQTAITAPHANHVTWSAQDRVRTLVTASDSGGGSSRAARCAKVFIYGYRRT